MQTCCMSPNGYYREVKVFLGVSTESTRRFANNFVVYFGEMKKTKRKSFQTLFNFPHAIFYLRKYVMFKISSKGSLYLIGRNTNKPTTYEVRFFFCPWLTRLTWQTNRAWIFRWISGRYILQSRTEWTHDRLTVK